MRAIALVLVAAALGACDAGGPGAQQDLGEAPDLARPPACTPTAPRVSAGALLVEYDDGAQPVVDLIDAAQRTIDLTMYQLSSAPVVDALAAAAGRGVKVRVIVDAKQTENGAAMSRLTAAGAEVKTSAPSFTFTHEKAMVVDGATALVFSGNFNDYSFDSERNYAFVDHDPDDADDLATVFQADFTGSRPDLSCTRLVIAPDNARARVIELIQSAQHTLDLEVLYVTDEQVKGELEAALGRGVQVRALFNDPSYGFADAQTPMALAAAGAEVRRSGRLFVHAKLIVADRERALIGSENFSRNSLDNNREVGAVVGRADLDLDRLLATFDADFAASPAL